VRMSRLLPFFILFGFMSLPVFPAFAACCSCSMGCNPRCGNCPGVGGCPTCSTEDFSTAQSGSASTPANSDMAVVDKPMTSIATNSQMLDRLIRVGQTGQCAANKLAMRILANGQQLPNFETTYIQSTENQLNTVVLRY